MTQTVPVLVNEDTIYARSPYPNALLFWRTAAPVVPLPQFILRGTAPPAFLHDDYSFRIYPPAQQFRQLSAVGARPNILLFRDSYRAPVVEDEYPRTNHQLYFQTKRTYVLTLGFGGFSIEVPDFCDEPWLEQVHRPPNPETALYPFRQIPRQIRGNQFNIFFNQPPSPRLDPEPDTLRPFDAGIMVIRQANAVQRILTTCGHLDIYDYGNGSILVAWGPFQ